jgi:hypothetical protein
MENTKKKTDSTHPSISSKEKKSEQWSRERSENSALENKHRTTEYDVTYIKRLKKEVENLNERGELLARANILKVFVKKFIQDKEAEVGIKFKIKFFFFGTSYDSFITEMYEFLKGECDIYCDLTLHLLYVHPLFNGVFNTKQKLFIINVLKKYNGDDKKITSILNEWSKNV